MNLKAKNYCGWMERNYWRYLTYLGPGVTTATVMTFFNARTMIVSSALESLKRRCGCSALHWQSSSKPDMSCATLQRSVLWQRYVPQYQWLRRWTLRRYLWPMLRMCVTHNCTQFAEKNSPKVFDHLDVVLPSIVTSLALAWIITWQTSP